MNQQTIKNLRHSSTKGFTLIELLIVIAILGVLAGVVLVAVNPIEQLARTRDAGRKTSVGQLSRALQANFTTHNGVYIGHAGNVGSTTTFSATNWLTILVNSGEIKSEPTNPAYAITTVSCEIAPAASNIGSVQDDFCYTASTSGVTGGEALIWTALESNTEKEKCPAVAEDPYFVWASLEGRAGVVCITAGSAQYTTPPANVGDITFVE